MTHREASEEGWIGLKAEFNAQVSKGGEVLKPFIVQRFRILQKKDSKRVKSGAYFLRGRITLLHIYRNQSLKEKGVSANPFFLLREGDADRRHNQLEKNIGTAFGKVTVTILGDL